MESLKKKNLCSIALMLFGIFVLITMSLNRFIGYDESYTLSLIKHSYLDVIRITALDVHPPLYYLILKFLTAPFSYHLIAVKLADFVPIILLVVLAKTWFGRIMDANWYIFALLTIPVVQTYVIPEIRMYGWIAVFVSASVMAALEIERGHRGFYFIFWISGLCAAYCHYFALVTIVCIYIALFLILILKKDRKTREWMPIFGAALASVICYLPWVFVFIDQVSDVSEDYWLAKPTWITYISYFMFPIYSKMNIVMGIGLFLIIAAIFGYCIIKRRFDVKWKYVVAALGVYTGMVLVGALSSIIVRPVFSVRYVKCVMPVIVFVFAYMLDRMREKKLRTVIVVVMIAFSIANVGTSLSIAGYNIEQFNAMMRFVEENIPQDAAVVHVDTGHPLGIISYEMADYTQYLPQELWKEEFEAFSPTLSVLNSSDEIEDKEIWIVGNENGIASKCKEIYFDEIDRSRCFSYKDGADWVNISFIRARIK